MSNSAAVGSSSSTLNPFDTAFCIANYALFTDLEAKTLGGGNSAAAPLVPVDTAPFYDAVTRMLNGAIQANPVYATAAGRLREKKPATQKAGVDALLNIKAQVDQWLANAAPAAQQAGTSLQQQALLRAVQTQLASKDAELVLATQRNAVLNAEKTQLEQEAQAAREEMLRVSSDYDKLNDEKTAAEARLVGDINALKQQLAQAQAQAANALAKAAAAAAGATNLDAAYALKGMQELEAKLRASTETNTKLATLLRTTTASSQLLGNTVSEYEKFIAAVDQQLQALVTARGVPVAASALSPTQLAIMIDAIAQARLDLSKALSMTQGNGNASAASATGSTSVTNTPAAAAAAAAASPSVSDHSSSSSSGSATNAAATASMTASAPPQTPTSSAPTLTPAAVQDLLKELALKVKGRDGPSVRQFYSDGTYGGALDALRDHWTDILQRSGVVAADLSSATAKPAKTLTDATFKDVLAAAWNQLQPYERKLLSYETIRDDLKLKQHMRLSDATAQYLMRVYNSAAQNRAKNPDLTVKDISTDVTSESHSARASDDAHYRDLMSEPVAGLPSISAPVGAAASATGNTAAAPDDNVGTLAAVANRVRLLWQD